MSVIKKPVLYGDMASPPMRFVMMTANILDIDVEVQKIDLFKSQNKSEYYTKINPLQKIPAMSINDFIIRDSHAIALYLCRSSSSKRVHLLYPEENIVKTGVDELLYYNSGTLFPIDSAIYTDFFAGVWSADNTAVGRWYSSMDYLQGRLDKQKWLTGNEMRLCDLCCAATVSSLEILLPLLERHDNVKKWMKEFKKLSCSYLNDIGVKRLQTYVSMFQQSL